MCPGMARNGTLHGLLGTGLMLALVAPAGGCLFGGYDGVYLEAEDVTIDLPDAGFGVSLPGLVEVNGIARVCDNFGIGFDVIGDIGVAKQISIEQLVDPARMVGDRCFEQL